MTIAVDIRTGAVLGQVTTARAFAPTAVNVRSGVPVRSGDWSSVHPRFITMLTRDGRYVR